MKPFLWAFFLWLHSASQVLAGSGAPRAQAGDSSDGTRALPALPSPAAPGVAAKQQGKLLLFSEFTQRVSEDPEAINDFIHAVEDWPGQGRIWAIDPITRRLLVEALRQVDKSFLDEFPRMTYRQLVVSLRALALSRGFLPDVTPDPGTARLLLSGSPKLPDKGDYMQDLGHHIGYGNILRYKLRSAYGDNVAMAEALNRLALNEPSAPPKYRLVFDDWNFARVNAFLKHLLAAGHRLRALDKRLFANFGDLWLTEKGFRHPVATPFLLDTGLERANGKPLYLPVTHAHIEVIIRGPEVNTDLMYYYAVDGEAMFRPVATEDQKWVGGRVVREWHGRKAIELIARAALARRELKEKVRRYNLPNNGYGILGACTDIHAMIVREPVYPQIRDSRFFQDGANLDSWANQPKLDPSRQPTAKELYDSLPFAAPGDIPIPQVRQAVIRLRKLARASS